MTKRDEKKGWQQGPKRLEAPFPAMLAPLDPNHPVRYRCIEYCYDKVAMLIILLHTVIESPSVVQQEIYHWQFFGNDVCLRSIVTYCVLLAQGRSRCELFLHLFPREPVIKTKKDSLSSTRGAVVHHQAVSQQALPPLRMAPPARRSPDPPNTGRICNIRPSTPEYSLPRHKQQQQPFSLQNVLTPIYSSRNQVLLLCTILPQHRRIVRLSTTVSDSPRHVDLHFTLNKAT